MRGARTPRRTFTMTIAEDKQKKNIYLHSKKAATAPRTRHRKNAANVKHER